MEEALVDIARNPNPPLSECCVQPGVQKDMLTDNRDQIQLPSRTQNGSGAADHRVQSHADRVEALRLSIASGTYQIDVAELALCIWRNTTHFLETR